MADYSFSWTGTKSQNKIDTLKNTASLYATVKQFQPDIIHSFSRIFYLLPWLLHRSIPKVMSYQREPSQNTVKLGHLIGQNSLTFTGCSEYICHQGKQFAGTWLMITQPLPSYYTIGYWSTNTLALFGRARGLPFGRLF